MQLPVRDPVEVIAIVTGVMVAVPLLLERRRIPGTVGVLVAGAVLGPNGLGLLERSDAIVLLGTMGLIYLMFTAALEIDLAVLKRSRVQSVGFGLVTFALPQLAGTVVFRYLLGCGWPEAILVGSMLASHTLLAYPVASRLGLGKNGAVTAALGATIVTDTLSLLVLAVVAASTHGKLDRAFWLQLGISLAVYVGGIFVLVPQLARWFFRHVKPDGPSEFVFVLATVFAAASLSNAAGVEPIVGAFLAGLALNRSIPHGSPLMNRIVFTGEALFIPFFLLSVGMLLDVRIFAAGLHSWLVSIALVACVIGGKYVAAEAGRLLFGFKRGEARVVFGLTLAQAAATLATAMVGYRVGLFDEAIVNGAILMMLVTCVWAPMLVDRHGRALALAQERTVSGDAPPQRILVSLSHPETAAPLVDLVLLLRDEGQEQPVYPFTVVRDRDAGPESVAFAEKLLSHAVARCTAADVATQPVTRIDLNIAAALGRARRELRISDIVMGWSDKPSAQERLFGSVLEHLLEDRQFSLWMARLRHPLNTTKRVAFCVPPHAVQEPGFATAGAAVKLLASRLAAPLVVYTPAFEKVAVDRALDALAPQLDHETAALEGWALLATALGEHVSELDLLVVYTPRPGSLAATPAIARAPQRLAGRFPQANLLVVYPGDGAGAAERSGVAAVPAATVSARLRERDVVFGLGRMPVADGIAAVVEEGLGTRAGAVLEHLLPELLASAKDVAPGVVQVSGTADVTEPVVLVGSSAEGLGREQGTVHVVLVALRPPAEAPQAQVDRLAELGRLAQAPDLVARVQAATGPADVLAALRAADQIAVTPAA